LNLSRMKLFKYVKNDPILCPKLNRISVDGKRFYQSPNGTKLPSVTTFLSHFKTDSIQKWRNRVGHDEANKISGRASRRGTKFHSLMESYVSNKNPNEFLYTDDVMPDMRQSFVDMVPVLDRIDNIHYVEAYLYSELIGLAGQTDLIAEFDGVPSIIDFKTSLKLKREEWIQDYFLQTTSYSLLYEDMTGIKAKQLVILIAVDHEPPQVFIKKRGEYVDTLYNRIKEYRSIYS
jgi:hypothetical protein